MNTFGQRVRKGLKYRFDRFTRKLGRDHRWTLRLANEPAELGELKTLARLAGRQTAFTSPRLFDRQLEVIRPPAIETAVPDLYLLELNDVAVIGATMAVVRDGRVLHPELLHTEPIHDLKAPDIYEFSDPGRRVLTFKTYTRFGGRRRIRRGVHLLKEHSANYYHWLFECLPRLIYFIENIRGIRPDEKFTLLVDHNIQEQGLDAMRRLIRFPFEIEKVRRGEVVYCDQLLYPSAFWYSLDNSKHRVDPYRDYAVDKYAVEMIRAAFRPLMKREKPSRKIYLPRLSTQVRRIINADQVEALMRARGLEFIYPHEFSFPEQVELFSSAQLVVGATGAAFSNLVFMQPGTRAVIFSPKQMEVFNYYIFQQQADVARVELAHLLTVPARPDHFYVHDDFYLNCDDLQTLIERIR
ncbi:MAG TPA: glycosyltransferase family 61 protein [Candidatus Acidoferrum sp.]|nr:glycosyltransferase family 61 protein [Candidatus Acidoferrum sp.]